MATAAEDLPTRWLKGVLEACVLGILRSGPAYGYDIALRVETAGFARPRGGSLYPILARLEADGLVEPYWVEGRGGPGRKYYSLTPAGASQASEAAAEWRRFAPRIGTLLDPTTDDDVQGTADAMRSARPGKA